jgi:serine protease
VTEIVNAGKVIVSATGNNSDTIIDEPANCTGVIGVAAHAIDGDLAYYANVSGQVAITAPGGLCGKLTSGSTCVDFVSSNGLGTYVTYNSGVTSPDPSPGGDSYFLGSGTSSAAPHVSGVAALLLSVKPTLTPAQIKSVLQSSARPFPAGSWCTAAGGAGLCGAGLLDAHAALQASASPPAVTITNASQVVAPNTTVSLSGTAVADLGRSISSYAWTQLTGISVGTIAHNNQADASFTAPATGTSTFRLTATDTGGLTGTATATVRVNSPPVLTAVAAQTVTLGNALTFVVGAMDVDSDAPIFVSVSLPSGASLSATGAFSWPAATPVGNYTVTYFARDNDANSAQGTMNISVVQATPGPPAAPAAPASAGGSGGCTLSQTGSVDMLLPALVLLSLVLWASRSKKMRFNLGTDQTGRK